ncbi:hypothetical protein [Pararhizobium antarcticum]|uniref:Glycosyltransferase RgtA/B/C/D-like domain-containing protein n=1 Tax=Pararhizobium antarcticum TaxID=1798805 RepID=A0A657LSR0_9HYPH|nr:hypothetical protein [Pararhizobium antarcticum]OJF95645.1 hypothetical protein AX760_19115 [Pararhizobium antarcticum]OJG00307.1 hypothetical protein AX761_08920 [Rhizobium sp. 58]
MAVTGTTVDLQDDAAAQTPASGRPGEQEAQRIRLVFCLAAGFFVTLFLCLYAKALLQDPDNWWQVKVGLDLTASRTMPTVDTYSYTFSGQPWIAKEWLAQVILAAGYTNLGWSGVAFMTITAVTATMFFLAWNLSASLKPILAVAVTLAITIAIAPVYNARPLIFSFPIIVLWTVLLFQAAREHRAPPFWALGLIMLWANLHATFTFGFVIAAFAGLDCLSRVGFKQRALIARWVLFGLLSVLITMINPYGFKAILATFTVASGNEAVALISEWRPFNARSDHGGEAALLIGIAAILLSGFRMRWTYVAFFLFTLHLFLSYSRFQYLWLLLVPIVVAVDVATQFPALSSRRWMAVPRDGLETLIAAHAKPISAALIAGWLAVGTLFVAYSGVSPSEKTGATGALAFARQEGLTGKVFNAYDFGGSLIFHGIQTYIDGRTDQLFLGGFMKSTFEMDTAAGKSLLQAQIGKYDIRWALLPPADDRIPTFRQLPGWRQAYADEFAVIYVNEN